MRPLLLPLLLVLGLAAPGANADVDLKIPPVQQATPVWCWLAIGEMVFRTFKVPSINEHFQCGIVGAVSIGTARDECARDCRRCNVPGGDATTVMGMLVEYPRRASMLTGTTVPRLFVAHTQALSPDEVKRELDAGRPIVAGINPNARPDIFGASAHVALIVGYRVVDGTLWLLVNDPFPFSPALWPDPYIAVGARLLEPGRYGVPYRTYTEQMGWVESFLVRKDGVHVTSPLRCMASTPLTETTCLAPPQAKPGQPCGCGIARGVVVDSG
jgi:hypothetical protein